MTGGSRLLRALRRSWRAFSSPASEASRPAGFAISLDYPVRSVPRYGYGKPPHPQLFELLDRGRSEYADRLKQFLSFTDEYLRIGLDATKPEDPRWHDQWFQGLDAVALYGMVAITNPARYLEIGSGSSTKFARRAIRDQKLRTHVTSIDPHPREEIDSICDAIVRSPLEDVDLVVFDQLEADDILFIDGSHRSFMNSDATVAFVDVIPALKPGVIVHVHDIFLPWDYPPQFEDRYYSEQYLLAAQLLAADDRTKVLLPNFFVCITPGLHHVLDPLWDRFTWSATPTNGLSFWFRKT